MSFSDHPAAGIDTPNQSAAATATPRLAGDGTTGFSGDGGPATSAELSFPVGAAVNSRGDVLITDNRRVRMITG